MEWISANWWTVIVPVFTGLVTIASIVAKATPNETDNKVVGVLLKIVDFFAMTTGKTEIKK